MTPGERRYMTRLMVIASILVALMAGATLWLTLHEPGAGPSPAATDSVQP